MSRDQVVLTEDEIYEALSFAKQILPLAGEIALRYFRQPLEVYNKKGEGQFDPVTCADREIEALLRDQLENRFSEYGIIGEEGGTKESRLDVSWVIDPIDGTKAYISGFPTWGILLGLLQRRQAVAGLMYQPMTRELFYGSSYGGGLLHYDQRFPLRTKQTERLEDAILYCTHEDMFADKDNLSAFRRIAAKCRLQRFGGDCYAYCMLATGQVDLVVEDTLQSYDIVPLIPIIEAAGGVVTNALGQSPVDGGFVVAAASRQLHEEAMSLL